MKHYYRIKAEDNHFAIQRRRFFVWRTLEKFACIGFARLAMANILIDDHNAVEVA